MAKLYSEIIGSPIIEENSLLMISRVRDILIDPENGKVTAFINPRREIVVSGDVLHVGTGLIIRDGDSLIPLNEVLRAEKIYTMKIGIIGAKVFTESKEYLGKVFDYEIDTNLMVLTKIHLAKFFIFFRFGEKIISYKNIIKINRHSIIVKDPSRKVPIKEEVPARTSAFAA